MRTYALLLTGCVSLLSYSAYPRDYKMGTVTVTDPWSRATPKGTTVAAGYMKIIDTGTTPDRLIGGSSDVVASFQIHEMTMENGVAKMRPLRDGLQIKPGEMVELKPGGLHVMLVGLKKPLSKGDRFKATLNFEKAGSVEVEFDVLAAGASPAREPDASQTHPH